MSSDFLGGQNSFTYFQKVSWEKKRKEKRKHGQKHLIETALLREPDSELNRIAFQDRGEFFASLTVKSYVNCIVASFES